MKALIAIGFSILTVWIIVTDAGNPKIKPNEKPGV